MANKILESYTITNEGFSMKVEIISLGEKVKKYHLISEKIPLATQALLEKVQQDLVGVVAVTAKEILDPKAIEELKARFKVKAKEILEQKLPKIEPSVRNVLIMNLMKEMLGLGDLDILVSDEFLEEIVVTSSSEPVRVFHKVYGWLETNIFLRDEIQAREYFNIIGRRVGRQITTLHPLLDANLLTGDRANAVLYPISTKGNTLTIRKFSRDPWTVTDLIKNKTADPHIFALIWFAVQYETNILISGGTGSGKTSFLNVCMPFIPPNHRIVSIEDTRELMLPDYLFWCPLVTREPNPEGKGEVTMLDLLINALRMRPDRVVLGEMRKQEQAEVLFEAMHTGHSVYATVHAGSVATTIRRLINPPLDVPINLLSAVNLNIVTYRNRQKNTRRVYEIGEFIVTEEKGNGLSVKPNIIYRWNPRTDKIVRVKRMANLFQDLTHVTGLSLKEINQDLKNKEKILTWMVRKNVRDSVSVGEVMHQYYLDPEKLVALVKKNASPDAILKGKAGK